MTLTFVPNTNCPKCGRFTVLLPGELVFPGFTRTYSWAFWTCWECQRIRAAKPFGWPRAKRFIEKWWTFQEVIAKMKATGGPHGSNTSNVGKRWWKKREKVREAKKW